MSKEYYANLKELDRLEKYLKRNNIPYRRFDKKGKTLWTYFEWHQIIVDRHKNHEKWDAVCHVRYYDPVYADLGWTSDSYGATEGLLETYGYLCNKFGTGDVLGWMTAKELINIYEQ